MRSNFPKAANGVVSYDWSSLNDKSMNLNAQAWNENWDPDEDPQIDPYGVNTRQRDMLICAEEMSTEERRLLRKRLRQELSRVRDIASKIEARELQLRRQSQSTGVYPSMSDAQFSVNDVRSAGGKEVTSQLQGTDNEAEFSRTGSQFCLSSPAHSSHLLRGQSNSGIHTDTEFSFKKHGKTAQVQKPHLSRSKGKTAPAVNPRMKPSNVNKRPSASNAGWMIEKGSIIPVSGRKYVDFFPHCKALLKELMTHKDGWVFNEPVDVVKLGLPDYHFVIKKPMDLGTIKGKLERKEYSLPQQFADDVQLTFKNAMTYNPPGDDVHEMAVELQQLFEENWRVLSHKLVIQDGGARQNARAAMCHSEGLATQQQWGLSPMRPIQVSNVSPVARCTEGVNSQQQDPQSVWPSLKAKVTNGSSFQARSKATTTNKLKVMEATSTPTMPKPLVKKTMPNPPPDKTKPLESCFVTPNKPEVPANPKAQGKPVPLPSKLVMQSEPKSQSKREMNYQEKANLIDRLQRLPSNMQDGIICLMKERNTNLSQKDDEIEVDIDSFDNDTLWELDDYINKCFESIDKSNTGGEYSNLPVTSKANQQPQGELQEEDEDVNIMSDKQNSMVPASNKGDGPSSSSSSSSGSGSSSDSDSESSSGSESDAP